MKRILSKLFAFALICGLTASFAYSQSSKPSDAPKPLMADKVFKNVQILKGLTEPEFMATMGFISGSLSANCTYCHGEESGGDWAKFAVDTPLKQTTRRMILMMSTINETYFAGRREVTCYSCHRGDTKPKVTLTLEQVYSTPPPPDEPDSLLPPAENPSAVDKVFNKYIEALGGAKGLASIKSFVGRGTYESYAEREKQPVDVYAKFPDMRTTIAHTPGGDTSTVFDGTNAWLSGRESDMPITLVQLTGADLDAARFDAQISFPLNVKSSLKQWRITSPTTLDGKDVNVVQGTADGKLPVTLYFDQKTSLLIRVLRYDESTIGFNASSVDYSDYREIGKTGAKLPFRIVATWLDGRSMIDFATIRLNTFIDDAKFAQPTPAATK